MKLIYGVFAGCLLVLPFGAWAQESVQGSGTTAPAAQPAPAATTPAVQPAPAATTPAVQPAPAATAPANTSAPAVKQPKKVSLPRGSVGHEAFTTAIKGREPANSVKSLNNDVHKVYFFTVLRGLAGQTVTHRWQYNGKVMAEVHFKVGGSRWRVWSSKNLEPGWTGTWKVSVLNGSGQVIAQDTFDYKVAPPKPAAPKPAPAMPTKGNGQSNAMPEKQGTPVQEAAPSASANGSSMPASQPAPSTQGQ